MKEGLMSIKKRLLVVVLVFSLLLSTTGFNLAFAEDMNTTEDGSSLSWNLEKDDEGTGDESLSSLGILPSTIELPDMTTATIGASVSYQAHVATIGWQEWVYDGALSGTENRALTLEALRVSLVNPPYSGGIEYNAHCENIGWQGWRSNGAEAGTTGQARRMEAVQIRLTGEMANYYDVYYRGHVQNFGWLGWAKNGDSAGSAGYGYRLEALEIILVTKGGAAPGDTSGAYVLAGAAEVAISYQAHVANIGWQGWVYNGALSGTENRALRIEAFKISLENPRYSGGVEYNAHCENIGWQGWKSNGAIAGTTNEARRVEAIQIRLTGEMANNYDVYYRSHVQNFGWLGWAKNGECSGSVVYGYRLEAMEIRLVPKGGAAPGSTNGAFRQPFYISYQAHVANMGWQGWVYDGALSGTENRALRIEAIRISLESPQHSGGVEYNVYCENIGWQGWKSNGAIAGTTNEARRIEAIQIRLTGEMANNYDVYYRGHVQNYGWLGWAKNGESSGSVGYWYRLEAMEIRLVTKGGAAPGSTNGTFYERGPITYISLSITVDQMIQYQRAGNTYITSISDQQLRDVIDPSLTINDYVFPDHPTTYRYGMYQFADLRNYTGLSAGQLNSIIESNSSGRNGMLRGQGAAFVTAAQTYRLNECYLLAHAVLESGWGSSTLATGYYYDGTVLVNNQYYPAGTYYNFFGIGAVDSGPLSGGRAYAIMNGWDSPEKAVIGGAKWIADNYIYRTAYDQPTLYHMKWDYVRSNATYAYGWHQYATDHLWARKIARSMGEFYTTLGVTPSLIYIVPVYK